jgi:hypothetical protein
MHVWQSKQVLKTASTYQVPSHVKNRTKSISNEDWERQVKEFKYNKLVVLDKVPKAVRKPREDGKQTNNTERKNRQ